MELEPIWTMKYKEKLSELWDYTHNQPGTNHDRLLHLLISIVQDQDDIIDDLHRKIHDLTPM